MLKILPENNKTPEGERDIPILQMGKLRLQRELEKSWSDNISLAVDGDKVRTKLRDINVLCEDPNMKAKQKIENIRRISFPYRDYGKEQHDPHTSS